MKGQHTYLHRMTSGNIATLTVTLPLPFRGRMKWSRRPSAADLAEWQQWGAVITADMTKLDGKEHRIRLHGSPYQRGSKGQPVRTSDA